MRLTKLNLTLAACAVLAGCSSVPHAPLRLAQQVDLTRFMGDWYVIANIPTFLERGAHNAVESYQLTSDGSIATTFTFRDGSFDGALKTYRPTGYVVDTTSNAVWGMQFLWPFKADFRIVFVAPDYSHTVIGREARDYVWIMARTPTLADSDYQAVLNMLKQEAYDVSRIERVPQRWDTQPRAATQDYIRVEKTI